MSDAEVIARLLSGPGEEGSIEIGGTILGPDGLSVLRDARPHDLARRRGVGADGAVRILAALELGRRVYGIGEDGPTFDSPETVFLHTRDLGRARREHFVILLLNARHRLIERETISIGSLTASIVHPREVFRPAIQGGAAALVLVHNHPSGDPAPSRDDVAITSRLVEVGAMVGIPVLDHVIVAGRRYVSLRREQLMGG